MIRRRNIELLILSIFMMIFITSLNLVVLHTLRLSWAISTSIWVINIIWTTRDLRKYPRMNRTDITAMEVFGDTKIL